MKDDEDKDNNEGFENFAEEDEDFKDKGNPFWMFCAFSFPLLMPRMHYPYFGNVNFEGWRRQR